MHDTHGKKVQPPPPSDKPPLPPEILAAQKESSKQPNVPSAPAADLSSAPDPAPASASASQDKAEPASAPVSPPQPQEPIEPKEQPPKQQETTAPTPQTIVPEGKEGTQSPQQVMAATPSQYSFKKAILLAIFLGVFGADRFYLGYSKLGKIKAATLGGLFLWAYADAILILLGFTEAADGSKLLGRDEDFKLAVGVFATVTLLALILLLGVLPMYLWSV